MNDVEEDGEALLVGGTPFLTYGLAAALVVVAGVGAMVFPGTNPAAMIGLDARAVAHGEWWRLATSMFLSVEPYRLLLTVSGLISAGHAIEAHSPRWQMPTVFFLSGLVGTGVTIFANPGPLACASAPVLGLIGYLIVADLLHPQLPGRIVNRALLCGVGLLVVGIVDRWWGGQVDTWIAPAMSGVAGAVFAWAQAPRRDETALISRAAWRGIGGISAVCLLLSCGFAVKVLLATPRDWIRDSAVKALLEQRNYESELVIVNTSNKPLDAYRVRFRNRGIIIGTVWRDSCCFVAVNGTTPLKPQAQARTNLPWGIELDGSRPELTLAVYADGSYDGSSSEAADLVDLRRAVANEASYWLSAIALEMRRPHVVRRWSLEQRWRRHVRPSRRTEQAFDALGVGGLVEAAGVNDDAFTDAAREMQLRLNAVARAVESKLELRPR